MHTHIHTHTDTHTDYITGVYKKHTKTHINTQTERHTCIKRHTEITHKGSERKRREIAVGQCKRKKEFTPPCAVVENNE